MHPHQYRKTLGAALTFAALTAPTASAQSGHAGWVVQPNPDQQGARPALAAAANPTTSRVVRPNPDQQAPQPAMVAAARPAPTTRVIQPNPDQQTPSSAPATIVLVTNPGGGFNWGDAGIGAAGALGLALLTVASALAIRQRRAHQTTRSPGAIS